MDKISLSSISIVGIVLILILSGCQTKPTEAPNVTITGAVITSGNVSTEVNATATVETPETTESTVKTDAPEATETPETSTSTSTEEAKDAAYTVTGVEGDLITLNIQAYDPDGFPLTYEYTKPFNEKGLWQTKDGDAGKYLVTVLASNGVLTSSANVLVVVKPSNKPAVISCPEYLTVKEGETVSLNCNFFDKEDDPIVVEYTGWMTSPTFTTGYESAGEHKVLVRATDGFSNTTATILIRIENVDRAPIFVNKLKDLTVVETDVVTLSPDITDPDKEDVLTMVYSEPFNSKGVWKTGIGDAGVYPVSIVASDGTLTTKESFTLTVKMLNTAPVLGFIPNITVAEGETITLKPDVKDREDDDVKITYSGWMKESSYTTTFEDGYPTGCATRGCTAKYMVTVTASDGEFKTSQDVYIFVEDKNRAPVFIVP